MALIGTLLISVLMVAVVPKVTAIFESLDRALPWYTQVLIGVSNFAAGYWWLIILMLIGGTWWFRRWKKTPSGRMKWDSFCLKAPICGRLIRMLSVSRFAKTLATLLAAGVPLLKAMEIVKNVLGNALLEKVIEEATGSIREGESIAEPLRRSGQFPPIVTHMIAVGEKSGQLEQMLESVANSYDAAQAERGLPTDRHAHDRGRREERAARADARERCQLLRFAGRNQRAGADQLARAADDRRDGSRGWLHRVFDHDAAHPDERLRAMRAIHSRSHGT